MKEVQPPSFGFTILLKNDGGERGAVKLKGNIGFASAATFAKFKKSVMIKI